MHILKRSLLLLGVTALTLTACKDDAAAPDTIAVTNITVSPPAVSVQQGQTTQVSATVSTNGGTGTIDLGVTWGSSNTSIAQVTAAGVVSGVAAGNATVTATSKANTAYSASIAVTVTGLPVQSNALTTFSVTPTAVSIVSGQTASTSTLETHAVGGTVTFAWSSSSPRCTVPAAGASQTITTVTAQGIGNCVITVTATGSGTGLITNSIAQTIAVTVTSSPTALLSLTVLPTSVNLVPLATAPACVVGTNTVSCQTVLTSTTASTGATVTFANVSSNTAVATVTATGANPVITATGNGIAQITITATGTGTGLATNSISAVVQVNVQASSVSISSLTTCLGGPPCVVGPVVLAGVLGQIEATMNISSGNQQIASVAIFIGPPVAGSCTVGVTYVEAARQIFGVNGAPNAPVTLSINTAKFNPATFVPDFINGPECIQARLFPVSGPNPDASNTIQFTLVNPDVVYYLTVAEQTPGTTAGAIGLNHTGNTAVQATGTANAWWKGGFTFRAHPVLYSGVANVVSITYTSAVAAGSGIGTAAACGSVAAAGPTFVATFTCATAETAQAIAAAVAIIYVPAYTLTASPVAFMTAASAGFVPGSPVFATNITFEDNVAPRTHTPLFVAAGFAIGGGLWTGNGSAGVLLPQAPSFLLVAPTVVPPTSYTVTATDFGVGGDVAGFGLVAAPTISQITLPVAAQLTFASGSTPAGIPLPETLTPTEYTNRGNAVGDILSNVGVTTSTALASLCAGGFPAGSTSRCADTGPYGVDLIVLDARYADGLYTTVPAAVANVARYQGANGSAVLGTGIFTTLGVAVAPAALWGPIDGVTESIFVDAIDSRSGINNAAAFSQAVRRFSAAGSVNCYLSAAGGDPLTVIQPNSYVQNPAPTAVMDCVAGVGVAGPGYYTWVGHVSDRANNRKKPVRGAGAGIVMDSIWIAIDGALPNITGIGFQAVPATYSGGLPATYSFSANDDLELKDGQISLNYFGAAGPCGAACASGSGVAFLGPIGRVTFPYGTAAYSSAAFGTPFDGTITNVLNASSLTLGYYIVRYDIATVAPFVPGPPATPPSGNVAGFTSSEVQSGVIANVRDVAYQQAAVPLAAPILFSQITDRLGGAGGAPGYITMLDFRIVGSAGLVVTVRDAAPSSVAVPFCDRVDIYEAVNVGGAAPAGANVMTANDASLGDAAGDGLRWRATIAGAPVLSDNGFQRFYTYTTAAGQLALPLGMPAATGLFVAACVKTGSALLSPIF